MKSGVLEGFLLLAGEHRSLQQLPDYTSPPLDVAIQATPVLYRSDEVVQEARDLDAAGNCTLDGNRCHIPFPVDETLFETPSKVGVIFFNGALVDPRGYSPIAARVNERYGMPVVMPIFERDFAFAFGTCDSGRLDLAKAEFPEVEKWVLAGHSAGGVAATADMWTRWNEMDGSAAGLVLLAADVNPGVGCGAIDFSETGLPMASVRAPNDGILNMTRASLNAAYNSNATFEVDVYGANHGSFGAYDDSLRFEILGQQDGEELIPSEVAWDIAAAAIANVAARTGVSLPKPAKSAEASDFVIEVEKAASEDKEESPTEETMKSGTVSSRVLIAAATIQVMSLALL